MQKFLGPALLAAMAFAPAAAGAQGVYADPLVIQEPVVVQQPMVVQQPLVRVPIGPEGIGAADAAAIARMNGIVYVEDVDRRMWDGNFKVKGEDARGETLVMRIDSRTGEVLEIDD